MHRRVQPYRVFVVLGIALKVALLVFTLVGHVWNICYVGENGYSLYVGNGWVEYGYG